MLNIQKAKTPLVVLFAAGVVLAAIGVLLWRQPATAPVTEEHIAPLAGPGETTNGAMLQEPGGLTTEAGAVEYATGVTGYFARPKAAGAYPGVVMIHEWWGLNDNIRQMAVELAQRGYAVLAVDLFGEVAATPDEARRLTSGLVQDRATENLRAAVRFLRDRGAERVASLGWCFGGGQSLRLALAEPLQATVIYYGSLVTDESSLRALRHPVLGIFGDRDQSIPVDSVRKFESALNKLGTTNEIFVYPGVGHAFANPSGANYAPEETKDAWAKTAGFLDKYLKP